MKQTKEQKAAKGLNPSLSPPPQVKEQYRLATFLGRGRKKK